MGDQAYQETGHNRSASDYLVVGVGIALGAVAGLSGGLEGKVSNRAQAQEPVRVAYADTNLRSHQVPDVAGLTPYKTKWLSKTDAVPGKETRMDFYDVDGAMVFTYSHRGQIYSIGMDFDRKAPVDVSLIDTKGDGKFERMEGNKPFKAPAWIR